MRYKSIKLLTFFLSLLLIACGGKDIVDTTGNIIGTIYDSESNRPLQGVSLSLSPLGKSTTTGRDGSYSFTDVEAGTYEVKASISGYNIDKKNITVEVGGNAKLDFHLTPSTPKLVLSQQTVDFGNDATTLTIDIKNTGFAILNWQISEDIEWLQCVPTSGTTSIGASSPLVLNVDRNGLTPGNYSQTIAISSNGGSAVIVVNISVLGISVHIEPEELDFGSTTTSLQLKLTNTSSQTVSYTLTPSNEWIKPSKTSGKFSKGYDIITIAVDRTSYSSGDYSGNLKLTVGDKSIDIPVRMNIPAKEAPTVTLNSISDITYSTVTFKGGLVSVGSSKVLKHGFCWDKNENPTISSASSCNMGDCSEPKDYEYMASQLEPDTKYYVRAYAENAEGIGYSTQMVFETLEQPKAPTVETGAVSEIKSDQVVVSGNIMKIGNDAGITQHGHVWSTEANPTTANNRTSLGEKTATGPFSSVITGLSPHKTYHVRAYASNSLGTSYGEDIVFTTSFDIVSLTTLEVTDITHSSASTGGSISYKGGHDVKERGVCWSFGANPTISDHRQASASKEDRFGVRINGLTELTDYHVRAYVITENSETYYGNDISFKTTHEIKLAQTSKTTVSNITTGSAQFRSSITNDGNGNVSDCGFVYSRMPSPTIDNATKISCGKLQAGNFTKKVDGLSDNTTYYVRSYIINEAGIYYGEEVNFATLEITKPEVSAIAIGRVTYKSVSLSAKVISAGNGTLTDVGFVYSTSPNAGMSNHKVSCGKTMEFTQKITPLIQETTYYVRAYATNEKGTTLGEETSFTTAKEPEGNDVSLDDYDEDNDWDK